MKAVSQMTSKELVAEYNELTKKSITKFSDRATAERKVLEERKKAAPQKEKPQWPFEGGADLPAAVKQAKKPAKPEGKIVRAHHRVVVDGKEYRSVFAAFVALGLDESKHIKFRTMLKKERAADFEGHNFSIVDGE